MAKQSGLGDNFYVDGVDLSGDVGALQRIGAPSQTLDVGGIDKSAHERIFGLYDGEISFNAFFNDAGAQEHLTLKAKGSGANRICSYFRGTTIGNAAAGLVAKQMNYDGNREADGKYTYDAQTLGNGFGLEYGEMLTAGKRVDNSASNGSSWDNGAASSTGLAAYLHVFAFAGTSITVKIQESSDNGAGDAFADVLGGTFAAVSAANVAQRIATTTLTQAVERYLRAVSTGTFSPAQFAVMISRSPVSL